MKKHIAATLISMTVLGTLIGCGNNTDIGKEEAAKAALADAGFEESDVTRLRVTKDRDDGRVLYEVEFTNNNMEYDYEVLASSGEIISSDIEKNSILGSDNSQTQTDDTNTSDNSQTQTDESNTDNNNQSQTNQQNDAGQSQSTQDNVQITREEAIKLALDRVPGATEQDIKIELDFDDGYYKYEGDIIYNQKEYEFEIDANTGTFLKWSEERR